MWIFYSLRLHANLLLVCLPVCPFLSRFGISFAQKQTQYFLLFVSFRKHIYSVNMEIVIGNDPITNIGNC